MEWQGDIGERAAIRFVSEKLKLTPDPRFDHFKHGFDGICRDRDGKLVIVEAKLHKRGIEALGDC